MEKTIMEQPEMPAENNVDVHEQIIEEKAIVDSSSQTGSNYGKFKDATSLLEAYNNLEKEFTKKSQKLSEILKQNSLDKTPNQDNEVQEIQPIFKNSNWQTRVSKFFEENPDAKAFSKEIANTLITDKELSKHKNCIEYAYALAQLKNQVKPADLLNNPKHIDDIMNNENIKQKIISKYIQDVNQNKTNMRFISGGPNVVSPTRPDNKPKTIKEASNILKKLLQN